MPESTNLADSQWIHIQQISPDPQIYALGDRHIQSHSSQLYGLQLGSCYLPIPSSTGEGYRITDWSNSDLPRLRGSNVVASS